MPPKTATKIGSSLPSRVAYYLLLACIPASLLCVVWLPHGAKVYVAENMPRAFALLDDIATIFPAWPQYFAVQTLLAAMLVVSAWAALRRRGQIKQLLLRNEMAFPATVIAYGLWSLASCFWATWSYGARGQAVREVPFLALCVAVVLLVRRPRQWRLVGKFYLVSILVQAALADLIIFGWAAEHGWRFRVAFHRFPVFYVNRNFSCAVFVTGAFLVAAVALNRVRELRRQSTDEQHRPPAAQFVLTSAAALAALIVLGFAFWTAGSLAGYVAAAVGLTAFVILNLGRKPRRYALQTLALIGVGCGVAFVVVRPLRSAALQWAYRPETTTEMRMIYWTTGARAFAERPLRGWGAGSWPNVWPRYKPPVASRMRTLGGMRAEHPHNELVRIGTDLGAAGLALYGVALAIAFIASYRQIVKLKGAERLVCSALWVGALAFQVQSVLGKASVGWGFAANQWFLLGLLASSLWWGRQQPGPSDAQAEMTPAAWAIVGATALIVAAAWWTWGVGAYASMVHLRRAEQARDFMHRHPAQDTRAIDDLIAHLERARPRSLWPPHILYLDYIIGTYHTRNGHWARAEDYISERVWPVAPGMLKTRLLLARCALGTGRRERALELALEHLAVNPYDAEGYRMLAAVDKQSALTLLERHVRLVEGPADPEKVLELLRLYADAGAWQNAKRLVETTRQAQTIDADALVQQLASELSAAGATERLVRLRESFPGILSGPQRD